MGKTSILKYIEEYLDELSSAKSKKGYVAWLRKNAAAADGSFAQTLAQTESDYRKKTSRSSKSAESLSNSGLGKSGYAKFIGESLKKSRDERLAQATEEYIKSDSENRLEYDEELLKREEAERVRLEKEESARLKAAEKAAAEKKKAEEKAEAERKKA